jgi:uncharacterized protein YnzC (UPF0291/DUF896 family)
MTFRLITTMDNKGNQVKNKKVVVIKKSSNIGKLTVSGP